MADQTSANERQVRATLISALVIGALLILLVAAYFFGQRLLVGSRADGNANTNSATVAGTANSLIPPEADEVFSRTGTITDLRGSTLTLQAVMYDAASSAYVNTALTITLNTATSYAQVDRTKPISPPLPGQPATQYPVTTIARGTLAAGDIATVFSKDNIRGLRSFTASEVRKVLTAATK